MGKYAAYEIFKNQNFVDSAPVSRKIGRQEDAQPKRVPTDLTFCLEQIYCSQNLFTEGKRCSLTFHQPLYITEIDCCIDQK